MTHTPVYNELGLLERLSNGEEPAFAEIFQHYHPIIYSYVLRLTGAETLAEEIVQDSFLKVWLKREALKNMENFGGWLFTIAANLTTDALRKLEASSKNQQKYASESRLLSTSFTPTETILLQKEYAQLIHDAVQSLPERQRISFQLVKEQGLTRDEAARQMGISIESVKTNLAMATQKIRAYCVARMGSLGMLMYIWMNR